MIEYDLKSKMVCKKLNVINDYIFLCFLLGNDFLEHIPSLIIRDNGIDFLINCYINVINSSKTNLINNNQININILSKIFFQISKSEEYFFKNIFNKKIYKDTIDLEKLNGNGNDVLYFYKDDYINYSNCGFKSRYYLINEINEGTLNNTCLNYIQGLQWTWEYYNGHRHSNWSWYYKYHSSPFASDIYNYISVNSFDIQKINFQPSKCLTPLEQLFMVLPRESLINILKELNLPLAIKTLRIFKTKSIDLYKYFPTNIKIDLINKEYIWQSKIYLSNFDNQILHIFL